MLVRASGHKMRTIHHGGVVLGEMPLSQFPQYHNAATQICWDPWTMQARQVQTSAVPYSLTSVPC
jgi:hypothetical protein